MKKQIIIENCYECPYFDAAMITCKGTPSKDEGMTKTIIEIPLDFIYEENIYERCPLRDAGDEETHYMVPKSTLQTAYAKLEGIIIDKNLHPSQCGYTAEIWTIREELRKILGYGD